MNANELLQDCAYFGFALTLVAFWLATLFCRKFPFPLWNPMLVAAVIIIAVLLIFDISVETYDQGAEYLKYFLNMSTVCLAIPLYRKLQILKDNLLAVLAGVLSGCLTSGASIFLLCKAFQLEEALYLSLLPKSVTTAIGLGITEQLGGVPAITVIGITVAGIVGATMAPALYKLFRITDPVAQGLGIGTASHALGTSKAVQIGEIQGAMSGLAIAVAGLITVVLAPIAAQLW